MQPQEWVLQLSLAALGSHVTPPRSTRTLLLLSPLVVLPQTLSLRTGTCSSVSRYFWDLRPYSRGPQEAMWAQQGGPVPQLAETHVLLELRW